MQDCPTGQAGPHSVRPAIDVISWGPFNSTAGHDGSLGRMTRSCKTGKRIGSDSMADKILVF